MANAVVIDTNIFVGAGFNPDSASGEILEQVREGSLCLVWNERTRHETERILRQIPPLRWGRFAELFRDADRHDGDLDTDAYGYVPPSEDRAFIALAEAVGARLITNDSDLLDVSQNADVPVLTPGEFLQRQGTG